MKKTKDVHTLLLSISIFYFVFYNSMWKQLYTSKVFYDIRYLILMTMVISLVFKVINSGIYNDKIIAFVMLCFFSTWAYLIERDSAIILFSFFSMYCLYIPIIQIIRAYTFGVFSAISLVVFFSLIGVLPVKVELLSFGFDNPNTLAFYIMLVSISIVTLNWNTSKPRVFIFYFIALIFCEFLLSAETAFYSMILFIMCYFVVNKKDDINIFLKWLMICFPFFVTLICWYLGISFGKYNWTFKVNHFFSSRIEIWNYYLSTYPVRLLPQKVELIKANDFVKIFFGNNLSPLMSGAFDGAFIYNLVTQGLIISLIILFLLSWSMKQILNWKILPLALLYSVLLIYSITETVPLAFIDYFQSYFLITCIVLFVNKATAFNEIKEYYQNN